MKLSLKNWIRELRYSYYTIGFIQGGLDAVMKCPQTEIEADFIKWNLIDNNGSWFADPFVLDVTDDAIVVLTEEMPRHIHKGVITKLTIDRNSFEVIKKKVVLELPNHLSFPDVVRYDDKVFICPENGLSGPLCMYEYNKESEIFEFKKVICDDVVWDSAVTDLFGDRYLFTAAKDDYCLDIYKWNEEKERFTAYQQIISKDRDSRLAGEPFHYEGKTYYPAQLCDKYYGRGVVIKEIEYDNDKFTTHKYRTLFSPHKTLRLGMHTLNHYKGIVVIDVKGFKHRHIGPIVNGVVSFILKLQGKSI